MFTHTLNENHNENPDQSLQPTETAGFEFSRSDFQKSDLYKFSAMLRKYFGGLNLLLAKKGGELNEYVHS